MMKNETEHEVRPTDAQIELRDRLVAICEKWGADDAADEIKEVLSLHPAPLFACEESAAIAAPVASPEPVAAEAVRRALGLYADSYATMNRIALRDGTPTVVEMRSIEVDIRRHMVNSVLHALAAIAPSPPTTPPAAEPGALTDARWRASKYGQEAAKLADDYLALTSYCGALKSQLAAYEASTAQGLSDAEIDAAFMASKLPHHMRFWMPELCNFALAILAAKETK